MDTWKNKLICGDNLEVLSTLPPDSVDLIYIDPPFFTNKNYEVIWNDAAEIRSFEDRWEGGIEVYIDWMRERVRELHRVLKSTGSFYLHCDWHASHYLKVMCDEIFTRSNFVNEVIWTYRRWPAKSKAYQRMHDTLLFYVKNSNSSYTFNTIQQPLADITLKIHKGKKQKAVIINGKRLSKDQLEESTGTPIPDYWYIPTIAGNARERLGYPTQKPEELLARIIKVSSRDSDLILDAFCGCGTAMAVAQKLGRRWVGIDISPAAITTVKNRLSLLGVSASRNLEIIGMPQTMDDLRKLRPNDFQSWAVAEMFGTISPSMVRDFGIDGYTFFHHYPIQVKQSDGVGRPVVDNFETALRRYYGNRKKDKKGVITAFSFTKGAHEEVARVKHKEGLDIDLLTVKTILERGYDKPSSIAQTLL